MARLTVIVALACAGLASAGDKELGEHCYASKTNECKPGLKCLGQQTGKTWNGLCLDKKTYNTCKFSYPSSKAVCWTCSGSG
jgi:hypothetical protein